MTVRELIKMLQTFDPERLVVVFDRDDEHIEALFAIQLTATIYDYSGSPLDKSSGYGSSTQRPAVLIR